MSGGRIRKLAILAIIGGIIAAVVKALRGEPAPHFSNHPSVNGGPVTPPAPSLVAAKAVAVADPAPQPEPKAPRAPKSVPTIEKAAEAAAVADPAPQPEPIEWVEPVDGACPDGYPIKAKLKSGIFHQPGGLAYDRTKPDRCYPTAEAAVADGLRPPKR